MEQVLYLPFDSDTDDDSPSGHTVTNNGVAIDTSIKAVGAGSGNFVDSDSDYLSIADSNDFFFDRENFKIVFYLYIEDQPPEDDSGEYFYYICGQTNDGNNRWAVVYFETDIYSPYYDQGIMIYSVSGSSLACRIASNSTLSYQTWYKVEVMRWESKIFIKIDDVFQTVGGTDVGTNAFGNISAAFQIGKNALSGYPMYLNGHLDELTIYRLRDGNWIGINF